MAKYNYNGIELPALPEWDKEKYPYAYLIHYPHEDRRYMPYYVWFSTAPVYKASSGNWCIDIPCASVAYFFEWPGLTGWGSVREDTTGYGHIIFYENVDMENPGTYDTVLVWCNHDVTYPDGTVYLAASDPVPVGSITFDPNSLLQGYLVGCRLRANRGKKTPIAYLYNGVQLPPLPDWDKETYPYAFIERAGLNPTVLVVCSGFEYGKDWTNQWCIIPAAGHKEWLLILPDVNTEWTELEQTEEYMLELSEIGWSNFNLLNEDGSIYLAASDPTPVYE